MSSLPIELQTVRLKAWLERAAALLTASLEPPRQELNEIDWKFSLSPDKKRLAEHLSAFSNYAGEGFIVFGVSSDGIPTDMEADAVETIINQLANIGRSSVECPVAIDHAVETFQGSRLLFVRIPEASVKPVHIRGKTIQDSFIRSGGTTRPASRADVGTMLLHSKTPKWEELRTTLLLTNDEICAKLDVNPIFKMLERTPPTSQNDLLDWMEAEHFINREPSGGGYITNLGAISAAREILDFPELSRKAVRVVIYNGLNKSHTKSEREGNYGYALSFQGLLNYVRQMLPQSEIIKNALRTTRRIYPSVALRELIANALIHQDFSVSGAGPMVEIFYDRIEISNPGTILPSKRLDRLIGTQPESRNELLARAFRRYKICEERGSGLVKAGLEIELYGLPPIEFKTGPNYFKVTLFSPRNYAQMSPRERLQACYQHAVLRHVSESTMTNKSLRERLKMPEKQRSMISVLIQEALDKGLIKYADPENRSKRFTEYLPKWA